MDAFFVVAAKYFFAVPIVLLAGYFFSRPRRQWFMRGLFALLSLALTYVLGLAARALYFDPRPFVVGHFTPLVAHASDNGFPSDHTLLTASLAMIGTIWNLRLGIVLWIFAVLVGVARIYVGIHHTLDIVGSIIIAALATLIVYKIFTYARHQPQTE